MRRVASFARRAGRRLLSATTRRPGRRGPKPITLTVVAEADALAATPDILRAEPLGPGLVGPLANASFSAARVANAWHVPAFGAVFDGKGRVFRTSARGALHLTPTLAALPNAHRRDEATLFLPPSDAPFVSRATVFVSWAGLHNYGHFLIDCLPALSAVLGVGGLERFPAIAPPLLPWQRALLRLMLGAEAALPTEIDAPIVRLGEAVFASSVGDGPDPHGPSLKVVRERILSNAALAERSSAPRRLYVSRLGAIRGRLVNEAEVEAALVARGYAIVHPDNLSVRDLIALFHQADIIVSQSGAALANVLFCKPGARVVEIQPSGRETVWSRDIARLIGADWRPFVESSPAVETEVLLADDLRPGAEFSWRLDLDAFLAFLDPSS